MPTYSTQIIHLKPPETAPPTPQKPNKNTKKPKQTAGNYYLCRMMLKQLYIYGHRKWAKLKRWSHTQGFGVQSPFAFDMVQSVLGEKLPYYAYASLLTADKQAGISTQLRDIRFRRLLFRLCNKQQTATALLPQGQEANAWWRYIHTACQHTQPLFYAQTSELQTLWPTDPTPHFIVLPMQMVQDDLKQSWLSLCQPQDWVLITGLRDHHDSKRLWQKIQTASNVQVSMDMYSVGLLIFNPTYTPKNYKVQVY